LIGVLHSPAESGLLAVYTPTARLIDGRDVKLGPAGCYRRAMAATIGAILDAQRRHQLEAAYKAGLTETASLSTLSRTRPAVDEARDTTQPANGGTK